MRECRPCGALLLLLLGACASEPQKAGPWVELLVRTPDDRAMRFRVDDQGLLSFGGGSDALEDRYTWSRPLSDQEIEAVRQVIAEQHLGSGPVHSTGEPRALHYDLRIDEAGRRRLSLQGQCQQVEALRELLDEMSRGRHERYLERLPRAGERPP